MTIHRQHFGRSGEDLAVAYLKKRGYRIVERNYRTPLGEIDIIARDHRTITFIEVKTRSTRAFGDAKTAITSRKKQHLSRAALCYLKRTNQMDRKARFDVLAIHFDRDQPHLELIQNAFELAYG